MAVSPYVGHTQSSSQVSLFSGVFSALPSFGRLVKLVSSAFFMGNVNGSLRDPSSEGYLARIHTISDRRAFISEPQKGWFLSSHNACGQFELGVIDADDTWKGQMQIAADYEPAGCHIFEDILTRLDRLENCQEVNSVSRVQAVPSQEVLPRVFNEPKLSIAVDEQLAECGKTIAELMKVVDQEIDLRHLEQVARSLREETGEVREPLEAGYYKSVLSVVAALGTVVTLFAEGVTAANTISGVGGTQSRGMIHHVGSNIFLGIAGIAVPMVQAKYGTVFGAALLSAMIDSRNKNAHLAIQETVKLHAEGSHFLAKVLSLVVGVYIAKSTVENRGESSPVRQGRLHQQMRSARILNGVVIRLGSVLMGHLLVASTRQTKMESYVAVLLAQVSYALTRPVLGAMVNTIHGEMLGYPQVPFYPMRHPVPQQGVNHGRQVAIHQNLNDLRQRVEQQHPAVRRIIGEELPRANEAVPRPPESAVVQRIHQKLEALAHAADVSRDDVEDLLPEYLKGVFVCPLTMRIMADPVSLPAEGAGFLYERSAAETWVQRQRTHPTLVGTGIDPSQALPSVKVLQAAIEDWVDREILRASL